MPTTIQNNTDQRVLLRFNSGQARYLAPRERLEGVEHVEVKGSGWINKLEGRHVIALQRTEDGSPLRSRAMNARAAIAHIERTPLEGLQDFLSPGEDRITVLEAMRDRRGA
jgi:hypothetical protein